MHAANSYTGSGSKLSKIAIVAAMHVGLAVALLSLKVMVDPPAQKVIDYVNLDEPVQPPKSEPVDLDLSTKKLVIDKIIVPPMPDDVPVIKDAPQLAKVEVSTGEPADTSKGSADGTGTSEVIAPAVKKERIFTAALANASDCARPDYPASAARNGEEGTVALSLLIGTNGRVSEARVQRSSGSRALDRAAVSALSLCKFKPAMNDGVAEPAWGQIAYVWSLD